VRNGELFFFLGGGHEQTYVETDIQTDDNGDYHAALSVMKLMLMLMLMNSFYLRANLLT